MACFFHSPTIVGWMPCLVANWAVVSSPRSASSATFALNSAEYRFRLLVIQIRPSQERTELKPLSEFVVPPQSCVCSPIGAVFVASFPASSSSSVGRSESGGASSCCGCDWGVNDLDGGLCCGCDWGANDLDGGLCCASALPACSQKAMESGASAAAVRIRFMLSPPVPRLPAATVRSIVHRCRRG